MTGITPYPATASAAVVVVGSELVEGIHRDTNGSEVARALSAAGYTTQEIRAVPDDHSRLEAHLRAVTAAYDLVVVTGGLGPTHDDVTREAAADAVGLPLVTHSGIEQRLLAIAVAHTQPAAVAQVMRQALIVDGATVLEPDTGTAPGQIIRTPRGHLVLLPGPPAEMRPMLIAALSSLARGHRSPPVVLGCVGLRESDAQLRAQHALEGHAGVGLTVLGRPGLVDVVLVDEGAGGAALQRAVSDVAEALGSHCYSMDGTSLAGVVVRDAASTGLTVGCAESCTGGLVSGAITEVPGSSAVFRGAIVAYADDVKTALLSVSPATLAAHGAVSEECAVEMAHGARGRLGVDISISVTGIAGPGGDTAEKPLGLVWLACARSDGVVTISRTYVGDRVGVRARATVTALDMLRTALRELR